MSLALQVRRYWRELAAVLGIVVISLAVGSYILSHQRLRFPWEDVYTVKADFTSGQAITPGQGQTVAVAGVTVGEITRVELHEGLARVTMEIDSGKLPAVHRDALMLVRPKTGLQDMSIELDPGSPRAGRLGEDAVVPAAQTKPNVNSDELLAALDSDTRAWLQTAIASGGQGLEGQGEALRELFKAAAPTLERTDRITNAIVARRGELARLVHNLRILAGAAADKDSELVELVDSGNAAIGALAEHDTALRESLQRLPGTLASARAALSSTRPFARRLKPALEALRPAVRELSPALPALDPLLADARPAARRIRGLVAETRPVLRDARPALRDLRAVTPRLSSAFNVLNHVVNELGYNPPGKEEGYLFWLSWFAHNAASILSVEDAQGVAWRGGLIMSCSSAALSEDLAPLLSLLAQSPACPTDSTQGGGP
jgi:phospholipid/cholesterol/gamma-HCH transport system substrate-binding protein